MMRLLPVVLVAAVLPSGAFAQVFGTPEGCDRHLGEPVLGDGAFTLSETEVAGHESVCAITKTVLLSKNETVLTAICSGEGETWEVDYVRETTDDPKVVVLYVQDTPSDKRELMLCE